MAAATHLQGWLGRALWFGHLYEEEQGSQPEAEGASPKACRGTITLRASKLHTQAADLAHSAFATEQALAYTALYLVGRMEGNDAKVVKEAAGQQGKPSQVSSGSQHSTASAPGERRCARRVCHPDVDAGSSAEPSMDLHAGYAEAHPSIEVEPVHPPAAHRRRLACACSCFGGSCRRSP